MTMNTLVRRGPVLVLALLVLSLALPSASTAGPTLIIQFTGMDFNYGSGSGGQLCDGGSCDGGGGVPATADPLNYMDFGIDTAGTLGSTTSDIWLNLRLDIPTLAVPAPGETTTVTGTTGVFNLLTQDATPGWGVQLTLTDWSVNFNSDAPVGSTELGPYSIGGSGNATVAAQDLPIPGIGYGGQVQFSFSSSSVNNLVASNGNAVSFTSQGTGELNGPYVPEPGTLFLLGGALSGLALLRRRRQ